MTIAHDTGMVGNLDHRALRRIPRRMPDNPNDRCTVVSIYPQKIIERNPTVQPNQFILESGSVTKPSVLEVSGVTWWKDTDPDQDLLEMRDFSILVAKGLIRDWAIGLFCCNMADIMPGLFYVMGAKTSDQVLKMKDKDDNFLVNVANEKQDRWYKALVKSADVDWARTNGNPICIGENAKLAARALNLTSKQWLIDEQVMELTRCPSCGELRNPSYPVCKHCHAVVDQKEFDGRKLSFARN